VSNHPLEEILHPQSIAVVGASGSGGRGGGFVTPLLELGYKGKIYPVNPRYTEIEGLKAYPNLREIPGSVDYVISAVPAPKVMGMLDDCIQKGVKAVHLFTARFSETGRRDAAELEQEILQKAREAGIRLIGPNCMGLYYPKLGISFRPDFTTESGAMGLASQSGQVAGELVTSATARGVRFSKVISYGNALDLNECDFLDYLIQDADTKVIMMYVEGVKNGQKFTRLLHQAAVTKPTIIIKGGRGKAGTRAAASHTAAMAGSIQIWQALVNQAEAVPAESLEEMVDLAVSFYFLPPIRGLRVGVAGGAGGASVLAADQCEDAGLDVIPLPTEIRQELKNRGIPIWDWLGNPADMSIRTDDNFTAGHMLEMMAGNDNFDFLMAIMGMPFRRGQQDVTADDFLNQYKLRELNHKPLLAIMSERTPGIDDHNDSIWKVMAEAKAKLIAAEIPFYPTIQRAARAARKMADYYQKRG